MTPYKIFLSSTIEDLREQRAAVEEELTLTEIFEAMRVEKMPALQEPSRSVCLEGVRESDAVVLIIGHRYGFTPEKNNPEGLSVTHLEFREAKRLGKPIFAYLADKLPSDDRIAKFTQEVSDFDEGLFRKTWGSVEELKLEVRRSLLFWLARRARGTATPPLRRGAVQQFRKAAVFGALPMAFKIVDASRSDRDGPALSGWRYLVLTELAQLCKNQFLPQPEPIEGDGPDQRGPTLALHAETSDTRLNVTIRLLKGHQAPDTDANKPSLMSPIELDVKPTPHGARLVARAAAACVYLVSEDVQKCIDYLLDSVNLKGTTSRSKASLIASAAYVSAFNTGRGSLEIARKTLRLQQPGPETTNAVTMALLAAQVRLQNVAARHALAKTENLALEVLLSALRSDDPPSSILYNLARQVLHRNPRLSLLFYARLLETDPSYDERWYFHRDLGLIHYQKGNRAAAATHYDIACQLKSNDSEVFRFAGDAYYYRGMWPEALLRYERAIEIEPVEEYFLDFKLDFAKRRLVDDLVSRRYFRARRSVSHAISWLGLRTAAIGLSRISRRVFQTATMINELNYDANTWLALIANRTGNYDVAIAALQTALAAIPQAPFTRLNLAMNMIFRDGGRFTEDSRRQAKRAIFHGGPEAKERFSLQLVRTSTADELRTEFNDVLFQDVKREREEWQKRRREVLRPETHADVLHVEFRE